MDKELSKQVETMFSALGDKGGMDAFPIPGTLSGLLSKQVVPSRITLTVTAKPQVLTYFATAAVEMWLRSIHSFLISLSLTNASPIWASVAGYYSSHYSVRAFAHLLGVFHLHNSRRIVYLEKDGNRYIFRIEKKHGGQREHKIYWKFVSAHSQLATDPFFYPNDEGHPQSDGSHRNKANYLDHIGTFPVFEPLEVQHLTERLDRISTIEFSSVPVPSADRFPDIDSVQVIAYHRLVKFRQFVDEILSTRNQFWNVQRTPHWCPASMNFSVVTSTLMSPNVNE